jgi:hypothetical protein
MLNRRESSNSVHRAADIGDERRSWLDHVGSGFVMYGAKMSHILIVWTSVVVRVSVLECWIPEASPDTVALRFLRSHRISHKSDQSSEASPQ